MSGQYSDGPTKTFTASGALAIYRRVRLDGNGRSVRLIREQPA